MTSSQLRILAFHGVPDRLKFERILDEILRSYTPVSEDRVASALSGGPALPPRPVWVTFDDGLPSAFACAALLARRGIRATAFVCPSVIDSDERLWFQTWADAQAAGVLQSAEWEELSLSRMKSFSDEERRAATAILSARLAKVLPGGFEQATQKTLEEWLSAGHFIGNHTWDHPLLNRCTADEQRAQVVKAHEDLVRRGFAPRFLAYPNGNSAPAAADAARELGYQGSLLFDHRLTKRTCDRQQLSRLRIDSDVSTRRAASILSGAHSALFHLAL